MKKNIAVYAGTFDPVTNGHLDIIQRGASIFDEVLVVLMENSEKNAMFTKEERLELLQKTCAQFPNVRCLIGDGLSVEFARLQQACAILRGVRTYKDFEYEMEIAAVNRHLASDIETVLLYANESLSFVSSSMIREMMKYGQDVQSFVQPVVAEKLEEKFKIVRK